MCLSLMDDQEVEVNFLRPFGFLLLGLLLLKKTFPVLWQNQIMVFIRLLVLDSYDNRIQTDVMLRYALPFKTGQFN